MILTLDIGNTRTKAGLFSGGRIREVFTYSGENRLGALGIALREKGAKIQYIGVANVGGEAMLESIHQFAQEFPQAELIQVHAGMKLPFGMDYETPATLGADRIAVVAGALKMAGNGPLLAITAGTAITWNLLTADNHFAGGAISPGIGMRFQALNQFTAQLPQVEPKGEFPLTGTNTETSIRSGVINGVIMEMKGMIQSWLAQQGSGLKIFLTGGDAGFLGNHLKNINFVGPDLQLEGIHYLISYNRGS